MKNYRRNLTWVAIFVLLLSQSCSPSQKEFSTFKKEFSGRELFRGLVFLKGDVANLIPEIQEQQEFIKNTLGQEHTSDFSKIEETILQQIEKNNPNYFHSFKQAIESGNHYKIAEVLSSSNDVVNEALLKMLNIPDASKQDAKKALDDFMKHRKEKISDLYQSYLKKEIDKAQLQNEVSNLLKKEDTNIAVFLGQREGDISNGDEGICLVINVVVLVNVVGYVNVVAQVNAAVAINIEAFVNIDKEVNITRKTKFDGSDTDKDKYINSIVTHLSK